MFANISTSHIYFVKQNYNSLINRYTYKVHYLALFFLFLTHPSSINPLCDGYFYEIASITDCWNMLKYEWSKNDCVNTHRIFNEKFKSMEYPCEKCIRNFIGGILYWEIANRPRKSLLSELWGKIEKSILQLHRLILWMWHFPKSKKPNKEEHSIIFSLHMLSGYLGVSMIFW